LSSYLRGFAMKLTRDKTLAEDLFQETALSAFRHQSKFRKDTNLKAWLSTIMKNCFINGYRKNQRRNELQDTSAESYFLNSFEGTAENEGEMNVNIAEITEVIDSLDEGFRMPFLMAYEGYQYDEIQVAMGNVPMGTVKSRIHHARKILKSKIREMYDEVAA
ncbi:MAG: sigma-70 family RNA polymerase sigma factor, partial [Bacteroidota bacterium]